MSLMKNGGITYKTTNRDFLDLKVSKDCDNLIRDMIVEHYPDILLKLVESKKTAITKWVDLKKTNYSHSRDIIESYRATCRFPQTTNNLS